MGIYTLAPLDLPEWIILQLRCGDETHCVRKPGTTSSVKCFGSAQSPPHSSLLFFLFSCTISPLWNNFIFASAQDPMSESTGCGRAEKADKAGCPFVLAGCGASEHPSLSDASIWGTPSPALPLPLTLEALSPRHVSAKWGLYTVLTSMTSLSTDHAGLSEKQLSMYFSSASWAGASMQQVSGGLILKAGGGGDGN